MSHHRGLDPATYRIWLSNGDKVDRLAQTVDIQDGAVYGDMYHESMTNTEGNPLPMTQWSYAAGTWTHFERLP